LKKLPTGISNYEELVNENYYYVDKTKYIEKLESLSDKRIMFLRPRKFGKTLFTSVLENYYDKLKAHKFEKLFQETYIGKNPTGLQNTYHILKFNFSGINTDTVEKTMQGFKDNVQISIDSFTKIYKIDFFVNENQTSEAMLLSLIEAFKLQKPEEKIYVILDDKRHNKRCKISRNGRIYQRRTNRHNGYTRNL